MSKLDEAKENLDRIRSKTSEGIEKLTVLEREKATLQLRLRAPASKAEKENLQDELAELDGQIESGYARQKTLYVEAGQVEQEYNLMLSQVQSARNTLETIANPPPWARSNHPAEVDQIKEKAKRVLHELTQ